MKKILFLFFVFISINAFSQMQVKEGSFKYVPGGVIDDKEEYTDGNELPMALIKISTENISEQERLKLKFSGNRATQIIKKPRTGQMWIYISAEPATFINIMHPDYGTCKYYLPETLCDYCVYEMVLQYIPIVASDEPLKPQNTYLVIKADQDDAVIYIDNQYAGTKQVSKSLTIGSTHTWKIECELYHEETGTVTLNEKTEIVKNLRPAYGYLNVISQPENGAIVFVNNKKVGTTPYQSERLASGSYKVKVVKEMYQDTEMTFVVTDSQTTNALLDMNANFVNVTINTDAKSSIYVDEEYKGVGTWQGRLSEGTHFVEARKKSHENSSKNINLVLGKSETINIKAPKPIYGFLDINSDPMSANIYLNEVKYGQTPNVISNLLIGDYELKLEIEGCPVLKKNITIKKGETLYVNETLETGKSIKLKTNLPGDRAYVDGEYVGLTPVNINLTYGTHEVRVERGEQTTSETIEVTTNGDSEFVFEFGKMITITSSEKGDIVYVDGKKVGTTDMMYDLSLGKHEVEVKRGKRSEVKTIDVTKDCLTYYKFSPHKEYMWDYVDNGVWFFSVDGAYSTKANLAYGLTFGLVNDWVEGIGWYVSVLSSPYLPKFNIGKVKNSVAILTGNNEVYRFSVMAGIIVPNINTDNIDLKFGAGYGSRLTYCETIDKSWVRYKPNTNMGLDLSMGILFNFKHFLTSIDIITTNFQTLELKLGIGTNWKKSK